MDFYDSIGSPTVTIHVGTDHNIKIEIFAQYMIV